MRRIPSLHALTALESFARHGTVWRAADELHLTRSAVSHRLRLLERDLGFQILNRVGTRIELTPQGLAHVEDVRRALNAIAGSAARHAGRGASGSVTVSCTPGFASSWLCNQIASFREACPDVSLSVVTPGRLDDVSNPAVDAFVAFGAGTWPDMAVERLVDVEFTPLCSPALLNRIGGLAAPADVTRACLLHLGSRDDWRSWLQRSGVDEAGARGGVVFSDMNLVYAAAMAGQGIAMGDEFVCGAAMAAGQLVRPFEMAIPSPHAYYLVVAETKADSPPVAAFCNWLRAAM
jgi:LysR family glycine cleavage system transcriptional activator